MGEAQRFAVVLTNGAGFTGVEFPGGQVVADGVQGTVSARDMGALLAGVPGAQVARTGSAGDAGALLEDWRRRAGLERHQRGGEVRGWMAVWAAAEAVLGAGGGVELPWAA